MYYLETESKMFAVTRTYELDVRANFENHSQQVDVFCTSARSDKNHSESQSDRDAYSKASQQQR